MEDYIKNIEGRRYCQLRHIYLDPYIIDPHPLTKFIFQYTLQGIFIQKYESFRDILDNYTINCGTVSAALRKSKNARTYSSGFLWERHL